MVPNDPTSAQKAHVFQPHELYIALSHLFPPRFPNRSISVARYQATMSGLESLAALGFACNILQSISFFGEIVRLSKDVYQSGKPDPGLADKGDNLADLSRTLKRQIDAQAQPVSQADDDLLKSAQKCVTAAEELQKEVGRLAIPADTTWLRGKLSAATGVWKTLWKKSHFNRLETTIADLQREMEMRILLGLRVKVDDLNIGQIRQREDLDAAFKTFLVQLSAGRTEISQLVQQSQNVQDVLRSETSRMDRSVGRLAQEFADRETSIQRILNASAVDAQKAFETAMRRREEEAANKQIKERFLGSLRFPEMNARMNKVEESTPRTFYWVLGIDDIEDNFSSEDADDSDEPYSEEDESSSDEVSEGSYDEGREDEEDGNAGMNGREQEDDDDNVRGNDGPEDSSDDRLENDEKDLDDTDEPVDDSDEEANTIAGADLPISDRDNLVEFLKSDEKLYWIYGKPGSGKSTLMKFIVNRKETRDALNEWRPNTRILSHYFWLPGSEMQRDIKGMLCSLLYQACITGDIPQLDHNLQLKYSTSDWSVSQLQKVAIEYFSVVSGSSTFCIFLDGLDEVRPEHNVRELLDFVNELRAFPRLKLCVASRPELAIKCRLLPCPSLAIDKLTAGDLWKYALATIPLTPENRLIFAYQCSDPAQEYFRFVKSLLHKAQGVFLWLALAIKQLRGGLERRDSLKQLQDRLQEMPDDLTALYKDMWVRQDKDHAVYRPISSLYLHLQLGFREINSFRRWDTISKYDTPSVFELAVASSDIDFLGAFIETGSLSVNQLQKICETATDNIATRCAGLLEITLRGQSQYTTLDFHRYPGKGGDYDAILQYTSMTVEFIHRTAYDFLENTADGKSILQSATEGKSHWARLVQAVLTRCALWETRILHKGRYQGPMMIECFNLIYSLRRSQKINIDEADQYLLFCEALYETGRLTCWPITEKAIKVKSTERGLIYPNFLSCAVGVAQMRGESMVESEFANDLTVASQVHRTISRSISVGGLKAWHEDSLSAALHAVCCYSNWPDGDRFRLGSRLIQLGANAKYEDIMPRYWWYESTTRYSCLGAVLVSLLDHLGLQGSRDWQKLSHNRHDPQADREAVSLILGLTKALADEDLNKRVVVNIMTFGEYTTAGATVPSYIVSVLGRRDAQACVIVVEASLSVLLDVVLRRLNPDFPSNPGVPSKFVQDGCRVLAIGMSKSIIGINYSLPTCEDSDYLIEALRQFMVIEGFQPLPNDAEHSYQLHSAASEVADCSEYLDWNFSDHLASLGHLSTSNGEDLIRAGADTQEVSWDTFCSSARRLQIIDESGVLREQATRPS